jgi:hypothetical protein
MIPKKGKVLPERARTSGAKVGYAAAIAGALRAELGDSHQAVKKLVRWTGANERTVKNWLSGRAGPNGRHLVLLVRHSDAALLAFLQLAQRRSVVGAIKVVEIHSYLTHSVAELGSMITDL